MKNKAKIISSISIVLILALILGISAMADSPTFRFMTGWGNTLSEHSAAVQDKDVYAVGRNTVITNTDIEQATEFYLLSGMDETAARAAAFDYVTQRETLYQSAIKNGYSVTDEEVWTYLEELKLPIADADNKDDVMAVMSQFDSEEAYWDFEFTVYRKNIPIQNYVHDIEQAFMQTSVYSDEQAGEREEAWQEYFEQMKDNLVSQEAYELIP